MLCTYQLRIEAIVQDTKEGAISPEQAIGEVKIILSQLEMSVHELLDQTHKLKKDVEKKLITSGEMLEDLEDITCLCSGH